MGLESPFWAQMEVFMELSELSSSSMSPPPASAEVSRRQYFLPVCFPRAGTVGLTD